MILQQVMMMSDKVKSRSSLKYLKNSIDCEFSIDFSKLSQEDTTELLPSYHTVRMNFDELSSEFVGNPEICPVFDVAEYKHHHTKSIQIKSKMDNYLGSVYSYNEHLRSIINRCLENSHIGSNNFIFDNNNDSRTDYSKRLELILGVRVVSQYGEYDAIDTTDVDSNVDGIEYRKLILDVQNFIEYDWRKEDKGQRLVRNIDETGTLDLMIKIHEFNQKFEKFNRACFYVLNKDKHKHYNKSSDLISDFRDGFHSF